MARRNATGAQPLGRRKRKIGSDVDCGGVVGGVFRRQATGGRGRRRSTGQSFVLSATGNFHRRLRRDLEGVPELIADVRKSLVSGDNAALFSAVIEVRSKLVEGNSAPFDLPIRSTNSSSRVGGGRGGGGAGGGGGGGGGAEPSHGHHYHGDDDEDDPYGQNSYRQVRRLDREAFVSLGGPELLLQVLKRPGSPADARSIPAAIVTRDMPVWKTTLVILRELCFTDQDLSERLGSQELILYLLTLMAYQGVFDLAVGLVEEILAVKSSTYFLGEVPELHSLVENMTSQQLAHFSRVLALLVFEPEYRQLMESAHVLRSMELLQLRRDRVVRADSIIDKNQALILSAPSLLPRLMELLRVMNYNPSLATFDEQAEELEQAHISQVRISVVAGDGTAEGRTLSQQQQQQPWPAASEWGYLADLRSAAQAVPAAASAETGSPDPGTAGGQASASEDAQAGAPRARSGSGSGGGGGGGGTEPSRIANFFRSIFRRSNSQRDEPPAAISPTATVATSASAFGAGEEGDGAPAGGGRRTSARSAADAADAAAEHLERSAQQHRDAAGAWGSAAERFQRAAAGGGGGAAIDIPPPPQPPVDAADGAGFAIRDLLNFLQPAFVGPDPAGTIASLEQALTWGGMGMMGPGGPGVGPGGGLGGPMGRPRLRQPTAEQARQELQFNGLMLAPHQVEVLFVLCTLLGARRKGEAHQALAKLGLIDVLDSMFDRLSWGVPSSTQGPHGAHCDCNPESALRVQYLRLVHNFLDRDSNNNPLKGLLLSEHERALFTAGRFMPNPNGSGNVVYVEAGAPESEAQLAFAWRGRAASSAVEDEGEGEGKREEEGGGEWVDTRGLLSKIVDVFMREPMDSLYRFWLASCVEAFLRGGSTQEQLFIAGGGLLPHLVKEITSDGMWCAGSLQTAFDLLGELCKGNRDILGMLEASMTEKQLRRFLGVMVDNLVDSNVFMRSLVLSVEQTSAARQELRAAEEEDEEEEEERDGESGVGPAAASRNADRQGEGDGESPDHECDGGGGGGGAWVEQDEEEPCYLGHTWYDVQPREVPLQEDSEDRHKSEFKEAGEGAEVAPRKAAAAAAEGAGSIKANGEMTRLQRFLMQNTPQLVRDLMCVVSLETINHENICCLNTAVLILIFADRRGQLAEVLEAVRKLPAGRGVSKEAEIDSEFDLDGDKAGDGGKEGLTWPSSVAKSGGDGCNSSGGGGGGGGGGCCHHHHPITGPADGGGGGGGGESPAKEGAAVLEGFRRLLWFWSEYYLRGGRDRLSLEFSTHVKFWAWKRVVRLLCADDGSPTALVGAPLRLPRSPYDTVLRQSPPSLPKQQHAQEHDEQ